MRPWIVCINEAEEDPAFWVYVYTQMTEPEIAECPLPVSRLIRDLVSIPCTPDEARKAVQWCAARFGSVWKKNLKARRLIEGEECPHCFGRGRLAWARPESAIPVVIYCGDCSGTGINQRDVVDHNFRGVKWASGAQRRKVAKAKETNAKQA